MSTPERDLCVAVDLLYMEKESAQRTRQRNPNSAELSNYHAPIIAQYEATVEAALKAYRFAQRNPGPASMKAMGDEILGET